MKSIRTSSAALCASLLLLVACEQQPYYGAPPAPGAPGIPLPDAAQFVTDQTHYSPGGSVMLQLTNTTARPVAFNLCRSTLERERDQNEWLPVQPVAPACPSGMGTLLPGQQTAFTFRLDPTLRPGGYRVRTELLDPGYGTRANVVSRFNLDKEGSD